MPTDVHSRTPVGLFAVLVAFIVLHAVPASSAGDARAEALASQAARIKATVGQDVTALERIISDDFVYVHTSGKVDTKAQHLELVQTGRIRWLSVEPEPPNVKTVGGETAILSGRARLVISTSADRPPTTAYVQYVEVYVKRDGRWQLTHMQSTRLDAPPAASGTPR